MTKVATHQRDRHQQIGVEAVVTVSLGLYKQRLWWRNIQCCSLSLWIWLPVGASRREFAKVAALVATQGEASIRSITWGSLRKAWKRAMLPLKKGTPRWVCTKKKCLKCHGRAKEPMVARRADIMDGRCDAEWEGEDLCRCDYATALIPPKPLWR